MNRLRTIRTEWWLLAFFVVLKLVLQYLLIHPDYDLHRDEYLHLDQGYHLAWGYISVPPFTSWISYLIIALGNSFFWVKFFPALFGALTIVIVWLIIDLLKGRLYAKVLAATLLTFSVMLRLNILYQPNSFDILSFTLIYFSIIQYIATRKDLWLIWGAVFFALGFLNKYNVLFPVASLIPALLLTKQRTLFLNKTVYIAAALALFLISPNLVWQYQHHFPVVHHMRELAASQLVNVARSDFLMQQVLFFIGGIFVWLAALIGFLVYPPFRPYRFVGWSFIITILLFTYLKAKGYYAIGLYPVLIAFGSVYLEEVLKYKRTYWLRPVSIVIIIALFIPVINVLFPIDKPEVIEQKSQKFKSFGLLKWEDGKDHILPQDFADMLGWKELAQKVVHLYDSLPQKEHTLIITNNYGQAGAINYYAHNRLGAVSFNADYINWFPKGKNIQQLIRVSEEGVSNEEKQLFHHITVIDSVTNRYAREKGTIIYLLQDGPDTLNQLIQQKVAERQWKD